MDNRELVMRFWAAANARDWPAFAALLHPDLVYRVPQTREVVRGREGFVDFFATYSGDWRVEIRTLVADAGGAVSEIAFVDEQGVQTGISFFGWRDGLIARIVDHWPVPYEPRPRLSRFVERE